jgi:glucosamine--fructose-6-phosphate aminotransferase (isomerizing)
MANGQFTLNEILSQPESWVAALQVLNEQRETLTTLWNENNYETVIFTGCGSTYYLSIAAATLLQEFVDVNVRALPASEIWLYPRSSFHKSRRTLLVAVSRSGATTETLHAVRKFQAEGKGHVLTLSCYGDAELAQMGDVNIVLPSGREQSIAQTRAFSTLYLAPVAISMMWGDQPDLLDELSKLPDVGRKVIENERAIAEIWGKDLTIKQFFFLGSGARYGLAAELSLKMKEMTLSYSEPFHFMEFRHGPQSMASTDTLLVGLVSESNAQYELQVLKDLSQRGVHTLSVGVGGSDYAFNVTFPAKLSEAAANVLYLPVGQMMAYERSIAKGLDPDNPKNLTAVVKLEP